ncbi:MAG TPA: hypothetical protein VMV54_08110, partial [Acidocella sp.]|nr:hypothetical protein [Acidocella sp.]
MAGWRIWSQRLLLGAMMLFPSLAAAAPFVTQRPPGPDDNTAAGYRPGDFWVYGKQVYVDDANGIWRRVVLTSEYPVDSVGGKIPAACYGTRKLRAAYRGPLIQVVNPQTRVATRIFADPGGALDQKALVTAMGDTKFLQVSVLYD